MVKLVECFILPSSKALPLVLLNLSSTLFGKHSLSLEIIISRPMRLDQRTCEPALLTGDLIYSKKWSPYAKRCYKE